MNRLTKPLTAALVAVFLLSVVAVGVTRPAQPALAAPTGPSLDGLSNQALIGAFDDSNSSNPDRAVHIAQRLWQRRKDIPRRDLLQAITDEKKPQVTRELMVDLLAGSSEEAKITDDARELLSDSRLGPALKARIVASHDFGPEDSSLLCSLASGSEDMVGFHALKKLGSADPMAARRLALAALARADECSDAKLSASYKVLVRSRTFKSDWAARSTLVRHLSSVLADPKTSPSLQDSAAFALADMRSLDALRILLESKKADVVLRVGAVEKNAMTIETALEQDPGEATIELAVTAMEIYPVNEIASPLLAARARVKSPELRQRLDAVLVCIASEGVPLNAKWTED